MSMAGRMAVFIRLVESSPKMAIREQSTAMVYGRRRARRTIHMLGRLRAQDAAAFRCRSGGRDATRKGRRAYRGVPAANTHRAAEYGATGRFLPDHKRGLRGRHAPTGLRHRRGVQREPTPLAAVPARARLPGGAAPGADPG